MKFTKMHGIGNDYVYVNCFKETVENPVEVAKFVSDRHFGIGSDGLILIKPSEVADCYMEMYNKCIYFGNDYAYKRDLSFCFEETVLLLICLFPLCITGFALKMSYNNCKRKTKTLPSV